MVRSARAERPTACRPLGFVKQSHGFRCTAFSTLEAVIRAIHAGLAESQRIYKEPLGFGNLSNGEHRAVKTANGDVRADLLRGPTPPLVAGILDNVHLQAGGVREADKLLPESFLNPAVRDLVVVQMVDPEFQ